MSRKTTSCWQHKILERDEFPPSRVIHVDAKEQQLVLMWAHGICSARKTMVL